MGHWNYNAGQLFLANCDQVSIVDLIGVKESIRVFVLALRTRLRINLSALGNDDTFRRD